MENEIRVKLVSALTEYDRKQSTKRGYNPHALALYFQALDDAMDQYRHGATIESALRYSFNDRVLTVCLKVLKQDRHTGLSTGSHNHATPNLPAYRSTGKRAATLTLVLPVPDCVRRLQSPDKGMVCECGCDHAPA